MRHVQRLGNQGRTAHDRGLARARLWFGAVQRGAGPVAIGQLASVTVGNSGAGVASTGRQHRHRQRLHQRHRRPQRGHHRRPGRRRRRPRARPPTPPPAPPPSTPARPTPRATSRRRASTRPPPAVGQLPTFTPFNPFGAAGPASNQSATVTNDGIAAATTGGNTRHRQQLRQHHRRPDEDGAVDALVGLGAPVNTSTGTAAITTGPANAAGNTATNGVNQAKVTNDGSGGFGSGAGGGGGRAGTGRASSTPPRSSPAPSRAR